MKSIVSFRRLSLYSALLFSSILISSCGSKTDLDAETATKNLLSKTKPEVVMSIAARDMLDKSGMSTGEVMPMSFKMLFSEMTDYVTNEKKTGLSFDGKSYAAFDLNEKGQFDNMFVVFNLKDPETFAKMIKEDLEVEPSEKEGYHYIVAAEENMAIGWYKTFGVAVAMDSKGSKEKITNKLSELMKSSIEEGEAPASYKTFIAEKTDIAFYYDMSSTLKMAADESRGKDKETINSIADMYKDSYSIYTINFDTDKITGEVKNFFNPDLDAKLSAMMGKGINESFMKFLTKSDLIGFFTLSMNPESSINFIKDISKAAYDEAEREISRETGIKINDITAGFTGELSMSMVSIESREKTNTYDIDGKEETYTYTSTEPIFTLTIGLKGDLIKNILDTVKILKKTDNYFVADQVFLCFTNDKLFMTNNEDFIKEVSTNGGLTTYTKNGVNTSATTNPGFGYFDFKALLNNLPENDKEAKSILENFDYAVASGNSKSMKAEIYLTKSGKNSLYTMTSTILNTFFTMAL